MTGRKKCVRIGHSSSGITSLNRGSPQGSILSPLLFNIYVSDMVLSTRASTSNYADETTIFLSNNNIQSSIRSLVKEAKNILTFLASNFLIANKDKTEFLVFSRDRRKLLEEKIKAGSAIVT